MCSRTRTSKGALERPGHREISHPIMMGNLYNITDNSEPKIVMLIKDSYTSVYSNNDIRLNLFLK